MFKAKIDILFFVWSQEKLSAAYRPELESSYVTQKKYWGNCARDDRLVTPLASQTCGGGVMFSVSGLKALFLLRDALFCSPIVPEIHSQEIWKAEIHLLEKRSLQFP